MSKKTFFIRYTLILKRLRQNEASLKQLSDYIDSNAVFLDEVISFSKRTFQRDVKEIRAIFNIDILYNSKSKSYYINNNTTSTTTDRMLEAFEVFNALNLADDLSHLIHFEKRKPQGTHHFYGLLHCIKNNYVTKFYYHKYDKDIIVKRVVEPYSLKEFKGRWYLLAKDQTDNHLKTFGLDRIKELDITKEKFKSPDNFNANELYKDFFGIINTSKDQAQEIILSFNKFNGEYIKSFPIHESQQVILDNGKETRVKLSLHTTLDFEIELLSHGDRVKIIAPDSLRKRILSIYKNAMDKNKIGY